MPTWLHYVMSLLLSLMLSLLDWLLRLITCDVCVCCSCLLLLLVLVARGVGGTFFFF